MFFHQHLEGTIPKYAIIIFDYILQSEKQINLTALHAPKLKFCSNRQFIILVGKEKNWENIICLNIACRSVKYLLYNNASCLFAIPGYSEGINYKWTYFIIWTWYYVHVNWHSNLFNPAVHNLHSIRPSK